MQFLQERNTLEITFTKVMPVDKRHRLRLQCGHRHGAALSYEHLLAGQAALTRR